MSLRVEFLGTSGALPTPRPLCGCAVCRQAREHGVPYARNNPSVFIHGPDVLIDTPGEILDQLNRSSVERIAACFYSHWHPDHTMGRHIFSTLNHGFPVCRIGRAAPHRSISRNRSLPTRAASSASGIT